MNLENGHYNVNHPIIVSVTLMFLGMTGGAFSAYPELGAPVTFLMTAISVTSFIAGVILLGLALIISTEKYRSDTAELKAVRSTEDEKTK